VTVRGTYGGAAKRGACGGGAASGAARVGPLRDGGERAGGSLLRVACGANGGVHGRPVGACLVLFGVPIVRVASQGVPLHVPSARALAPYCRQAARRPGASVPRRPPLLCPTREGTPRLQRRSRPSSTGLTRVPSHRPFPALCLTSSPPPFPLGGAQWHAALNVDSR